LKLYRSKIAWTLLVAYTITYFSFRVTFKTFHEGKCLALMACYRGAVAGATEVLQKWFSSLQGSFGQVWRLQFCLTGMGLLLASCGQGLGMLLSTYSTGQLPTTLGYPAPSVSWLLLLCFNCISVSTAPVPQSDRV
jgi:hypothetical protein